MGLYSGVKIHIGFDQHATLLFQASNQENESRMSPEMPKHCKVIAMYLKKIFPEYEPKRLNWDVSSQVEVGTSCYPAARAQKSKKQRRNDLF